MSLILLLRLRDSYKRVGRKIVRTRGSELPQESSVFRVWKYSCTREFTVGVTACTYSSQTKMPGWNRGGHEISPLADEILVLGSFWGRVWYVWNVAQLMATHPSVNGQHKLNLMGSKTKQNKRGSKVGWSRKGVNLGGVGGGCYYNQNTLYEILEEYKKASG